MQHLSRRHVLATLPFMSCASTRPAWAAEPPDPKPSYVSLGEFTVNLPQQNRRDLSYAVVDITLDAAPGAASHLRDLLPLLKEAVLRRLLSLAGEGELKPDETDPVALKKVLLQSIDRLEPNRVRDVLITRLLYG